MNERDDILKTEDRPADRAVVAPPSLDIAKYRDLLGETDIPQESVDEYLGCIAAMMASFVAWGWDVRNIPAFLPELFDPSSATESAALPSDDDRKAVDDEF